MKILFLENHSTFANVVIPRFLGKHQVEVLNTLAQARSRLDIGEYEAILCDYDLEDGKGSDFVWEVRQQGHRMPIIAVSAREQGNQALMEAGADVICDKINFKNIELVLAEFANEAPVSLNPRKPIIGVMGPRTADQVVFATAQELGARIAQRGWILLSGGIAQGVMEAVNRGARQAGGLTLGILPDADDSQASQYVDIAVITGMGSGRNPINVLTAHAVVACGMGLGTASEVALAMKAGKPVALLHASEHCIRFFKELGKVESFDKVGNALDWLAVHLRNQSQKP